MVADIGGIDLCGMVVVMPTDLGNLSLSERVQDAHPDVDVDAVLADAGRADVAEVRDLLLEQGYDAGDVDRLVAS